jgi:deoxyribonuclease-1-like protein
MRSVLLVFLLSCGLIAAQEPMAGSRLVRDGVLRESPGGKSKRIAVVKKDTVVSLVEATPSGNGWFHVNANGQDGWIFGQHLAQAAPSTIKIGSFNVLHLGWGKNKDVDRLASVIADFDVCALLEVMDKPPEEELLQALDAVSTTREGKQVRWRMVKSGLVGRTSYKERYAFVFREPVALLEEGRFVDDEEDVYDRDPFYATFMAGRFDFTLVAVHITFGSSEKDRVREIGGLPKVVEQIRATNPVENDVILVGDFNLPADHKYWMPVTATMTNTIPPTTKTTLDSKKYVSSYDNIWYNATYTANEYTGNTGAIMTVERLFPDDTEGFKLTKQTVSDHVPVWAEFRVDGKDDDP